MTSLQLCRQTWGTAFCELIKGGTSRAARSRAGQRANDSEAGKEGRSGRQDEDVRM